MKWFHLGFGILLFVAFVTTGRFMRADFPDKEAIGEALRLLMRSRHIYIFFCAMIHLGLGVYFQPRPQLWRRALQYTGSILLAASGVILICAFVSETYYLGHFSRLSAVGIFATLGGIAFHLIGGITTRKPAQV